MTKQHKFLARELARTAGVATQAKVMFPVPKRDSSTPAKSTSPQVEGGVA